MRYRVLNFEKTKKQSKMRITLISIPVRDQEKALKFYTEKLGFIKKKDTPLGGGNRWLTLVSKDLQDGPELLGYPYTQFDVDDVEAEYERLTKLGVEFSIKPATMGTVKYAVLNDTCGNNIQLVEEL